MEQTILSHLIYNEQYARKILPFLKSDYFETDAGKKLYGLIENHIDKYNELPTKEILFIELQNSDDLNETQYTAVKETISGLEIEETATNKLQWLVDETEKFCQDKAVYNAIRKSIKILDAKSDLAKGSIPQLLTDALSVSFDTHIGHDFLDDTDSRYDSYHVVEERIQFDIDYLNKITNGGLPGKTLTCLMASTGVGKSMVMCHMAATNLMQNKNVLYITLEMAEERIAQRIDANLLDVGMQGIMDLSKEEYDRKIQRLRQTTKGRLIIKEYPTTSAGSAHFRHLLNELKIKKNFVPDIIYIDYLNICASSRIKNGAAVNSYTYIKAIAEELRGLAMEFKLPLVTATQSNRDAANSSDMSIDNVSDSFGTAMTVDLMLAIIQTEELRDLNQLLFKQLKNRLGDPSRYNRFIVGVNSNFMRLYDVSDNEQEDLMDGPLFDSTDFGGEEIERNKKFDKSKFKGFR